MIKKGVISDVPIPMVIPEEQHIRFKKGIDSYYIYRCDRCNKVIVTSRVGISVSKTLKYKEVYYLFCTGCMPVVELNPLPYLTKEGKKEPEPLSGSQKLPSRVRCRNRVRVR